MIRRIINGILTIIILLTLAACWDKVELEERAYVISIGVDRHKPHEKKNENENETKDKKNNDEKDDDENDNKEDIDGIFAVSMALPDLFSTGKDSGAEDVKTAIGRTIHAAIGSTDRFSGKKLYFGHTKLIVLSDEILKDEKLLRETIDAFERNEQISGRTIVLSTEEKAKKILENNPPTESMAGVFVTSFYRSGHNTAGTSFKQDLTGVIRELRGKKSTIIPKIGLRGKEFEIGGGALVSEFKLTKWLTEEEMRGYLWTKGQAAGATIEAQRDGIFLPLKINKNNSRTTFSKVNDTVICQTDIKIEGSLESFIFGKALGEGTDLQELERQYENLILNEILKADESINLLEFELLDEMRRKSSRLYGDYETGKKDAGVVWNVTVKITGAGDLVL